ncbi:Molybdopterin or thiamine biosynthesis adenylyltransferase [Ruegeria intermedia]|uniref:Molybdopterin or thiamine biosynthesis adenylyltransferase n=1 Tax=Ruegeria intermedia TaxID=996115 RepID=A0A1M5BG98_9RHOB|nr:HesA/MoeB/ThiF family protein [Ruegeria intermedia]SHF41469.1 Molybdopterin or thiamine biosynthesis adenylyltransferase [Ruegeria intermedia]
MSRYSRQELLPEIGPNGQAKLARAHVIVAGAGGLASTVLPLLAGAGIGHLTLFDPDRVEEHNLHRQTMYRMADLGAPKAEAAARHLSALNPRIRIDAIARPLWPDAEAGWLNGADLVIDAADTLAASYALSDHCHATATPFLSASVQGRRGHVGGFCGGVAPSLRAIFTDPDPGAASCASAGVMGPAVALLGALQAQMALAVLLGHKPSPLGLMISADLAGWQLSRFRFEQAPEPDTPMPEVIAPGRLQPDDFLIDLRRGEVPPARVPPGARVVFLCATGLRAWRAARALAARGHTRVAVAAAGEAP